MSRKLVRKENMKKLITLGAIAVVLVGCGSDDSSSETGATGETGAIATEEQVTESFSQWRYQRASRTSTNEISVHVEDISCTIESEGEAKCYEKVVINSLYVGKQVSNYVWDVAYDTETGEMYYAEIIN
jgi:hypothetical protein